MELKEPCTPFDIATWCKTAANQSEGLSISQAVRIMNMIEAFGKAQYNQALTDAAGSSINFDSYTKEQIIALKKH